jgi:hypothetical protein
MYEKQVHDIIVFLREEIGHVCGVTHRINCQTLDSYSGFEWSADVPPGCGSKRGRVFQGDLRRFLRVMWVSMAYLFPSTPNLTH